MTRTAFFAALLVTATAFSAEAPYERELTQLKAQRDKAVATAVEPINRRYKESLEQLLRKATQGNDLDTALKIKTELGIAGTPLPAATQPPPPATATPEVKPKAAPAAPAAALTDLKLQLPGSKWRKTSFNTKTEFRPDGVIKQGAQVGKYEVKSRDKVTITIETGKPQLLYLSRNGRELEIQKGIPAYVLESAN